MEQKEHQWWKEGQREMVAEEQRVQCVSGDGGGTLGRGLTPLWPRVWGYPASSWQGPQGTVRTQRQKKLSQCNSGKET